MAYMALCKVGCGVYHDPKLNCGVAKRKLTAGTLEEPWLSRNREVIHARLMEEFKDTVDVKAEVSRSEQSHKKPGVASTVPVQTFVCPVCAAKRAKKAEQMAKYRAKRRATNGG